MRAIFLRALAASGFIATAGGCFSCFVAGTRILTPKGPKPIESIRVGDQVWSWNTDKHSAVVRKVVRLYGGENRKTRRLMAGEQIIAGVTSEHPFWNPLKAEWVKSKDLELRDAVLCWLGQHQAKSLPLRQIEEQTHDEPQKVYTFEVEGPEHNYFAEGILVHNKSVFNPNDIQDEGPCVELLGLESESIHDFGALFINETLAHTVEIKTLDPGQRCNEPVAGEELQLLLDDPDNAFTILNEPEITYEQLFEQNQTFQIAFTPPTEGDFEAQLRIGFPSSMDDEFHSDLLIQLFGSGVAETSE